jgi:hypothetical protein
MMTYLENEKLSMSINLRRGIVYSLKMKQDGMGTECLGTPDNTHFPTIMELNQWVGDVKLRIWDEKTKQWTLELTEKSRDIRQTSYSEGQYAQIQYLGGSRQKNGIVNVALQERFFLTKDYIGMDLTLENITHRPLEIGELSMSFTTNSDYAGLFENKDFDHLEKWRGYQQKTWHEDRFQVFHSINGSSSYVLLQKPMGGYPALLFQTAEGTGLEVAYQMDSEIGSQWSVIFEGPYYLSVYSNAARKCGKWKYDLDRQAYGLNGNSSLMLNPGEKKTLHFRFTAIESLAELGEALYQAGQLSVDVQPGMVVPVGETIQMRLRSRNKITFIPAANHIHFKMKKEDKDSTYWEIVFTQRGQKKIRIEHGDGVTFLFFYGIEEVKELIKKRASFAITRHYYENPYDPFQRHHSFLAFDDMVEMIYTESEETFQAAALDEHGLPIPMFLAAKNEYDPDQKEIDVLEEFVEDSLYGVLQERDTFLVRRSMLYEEKVPSDEGIYKFSEEESMDTSRAFNYVLIANIYRSLYDIGKKFNMTKRRTGIEYLNMAYKTAMTGFRVGDHNINAGPGGAAYLKLLEALRREDHDKYEMLNHEMEYMATENARSEYPFGSELFIDQTAHSQYQALMKYYGYEDKLEKIYSVIKGLRSGFQPAWFWYGNDKRGSVCCWYATPFNSRALFDGFENTGDMDMLKLGYAGISSFLTCIKSSGAAHGWYLWWPDRTGFDLRSLDTDMGMFAYIEGVRSYVVEDPIFGLCGYGCRIKEEKEDYTKTKIGMAGKESETGNATAFHRYVIEPYDGIGNRVVLCPYHIDIRAEYGSIMKIELDEREKTCRVWVHQYMMGEQEARLNYTALSEWQINALLST